MDNGKQEAFPVQAFSIRNGLTKREYIATQLMQGIISTMPNNDITYAIDSRLAHIAVLYADELLKHLK